MAAKKTACLPELGRDYRSESNTILRLQAGEDYIAALEAKLEKVASAPPRDAATQEGTTSEASQ